MKVHALLLAACCAAGFPGIASGAEIYKCTDDDGNVAYLQLPCPEQKEADELPAPEAEMPVADDSDGFMNIVPEPEAEIAAPPSSRRPEETLDECKDRYRDQIDAIDAELGVSLSAAEAQDYRERLRTLTLQLRACE